MQPQNQINPTTFQPEDVLTPQDTLEPTSPSPVVAAPSIAAATTSPAPTVSSPAPKSPMAPVWQSRLLRKTLFLSLGMVVVIGLTVAATFLFQKTHHSDLSQAQKLAQVKDQAVSLSNGQLSAGDTSQLRSGVSTLYINGDVAAQGQLVLGSSSASGQLSASSLTQNQNYQLPNSSGTVCLNSNNCGYLTSGQAASLVQKTGGVSSLQGTDGQVLVSGSTGQVRLSLPQDISSSSSPTFSGLKLTSAGQQNGSVICDASNNCNFANLSNSLTQGGNSFATALSLGTLDANAVNLLSGGSTVASFSNLGQANFQNSTDSTIGFRVQNAASDSLFTVDTSNNQIVLGSSSASPTILTLGISNVSSDPTGADGQIYYNAALGKFRCYQSGAWNNCIGASGSGTGDVNQGGNNYGTTMVIGTLDNQPLAFIVNGQTVSGYDQNGAFYLFNAIDSSNALNVASTEGHRTLNVSTLNDSLQLYGGASIANTPAALDLTSGSVSATTPNASSNQLAGDIDIYARIQPSNWCSLSQPVIYKLFSYGLFTNNCKLAFLYGRDGSTLSSVNSSVAVPFSNGTAGWIRVTFSSSTGTVKFYTAEDKTMPGLADWLQLGTDQTITPGGMYPSTSPVIIGGGFLGSFTGDIYSARVLNGIEGTPVVFFDASMSYGNSTWSQAEGSITNVWTILGGGRVLGAPSQFGGRLGIATVANNLLSVNSPTTQDLSAQALISTYGVANKGLVLQGVNGQTGDLLQNQSSDGMVLSGFNGGGGLYTNGLTSNLYALASPYNYCPYVSCPSMLTTGGTLGVGTYYYTITSIGANGVEAVPAKTFTLTATTNTSSANFGWVYMPGAVSYKIYRSTSPSFGASSLLTTISAIPGGIAGAYIDAGSSTVSGAPPISTIGSSFNVQAWDGQSTGTLQVQNSAGVTLSGFNGTGGLFTNGTSSSLKALTTPSITLTPYGSGGALAANTYYYAVTAVNSAGESTAAQATASTTTTGTTSVVTIRWNAVPGATSYNVYRSSDSTGGAKFGSNSFLGTAAATTPTVTYNDFGGNSLSAGRPSTATTGTGLSLQGWDGQSGDLLQLQSPSGTTLSSFSANGSLNITSGTTIVALPTLISLDGLSGNFSVSTPNASANQITGPIQIVARLKLKTWANGISYQTIAGKYDGVAADSSWLLRVSPTGYLDLKIAVGSTITEVQSTVPIGAAANTTTSVLVRRDSVTGQVLFFTSASGSSYNQLGAIVSGPTGNMNAGNQPVQVGAWGSNEPMQGGVERVQLYNGTTLVNDMFASQANSTGVTSWPSYLTGETWTITGTAKLNGAGSQLTIATASAGTNGIVLQAASGQTADLLQFNDPSANKLFSVDGGGGLHVTNGQPSGIGTYGIGGVTLAIATRGSDIIGLVVSGSTGQTADLQQWQNYTGTILASVNGAGQGSFSNLLQNSNQVCDISNNCDYMSGDTSSYLQNGLIYFDGTSLVSTAAGSSGQCLIGTAGAPAWGGCGGTGTGTGDVNQGGNTYGATMVLGTTDNYGFNFLANNHVVAKFSNTGQATFQNSADSVTAFQIQNAAGTSLFTVDSSNSIIYVGNPTPDSTGTLLVLDNKNTSGDPAGLDGAMYYNSYLDKFRCYQGGTWQNCLNNGQMAVKTASQTFNTITFGNIDDLNFNVVANTNYRLQCSLVLSVASGSNGGYLSTLGPASPSQYTASFTKSLVSGDTYATSSSYDDIGSTNIKTSSTAGNRFIVNYSAVLLNGANSGSWNLRSRAYDGSSSITFYPGSSCNLEVLSN